MHRWHKGSLTTLPN